MTRIAVVGTGNWGKNLVRTFNQLGVLWGFADANPKLVQAQKALYPEAHDCRSLDEIIGAGEADAVAIATPAVDHYSTARRALEAGLHVFVEKPITLDPAHAEELVELADKKNLTLMVGHLMLYHPGVSRMKELVDSGELGDVHYMYGQRVNLGQVRRDENAMWSLGPHDVSVAMYLFQGMPVRVSAVGSTYVQSDLEVEDVVFLNLLFADGRMANIHVSWLDPHKIRRLTLVGSRKMVVFDDMEANEKLKIYDKGVRTGHQGGQYESYGDLITLRFGDILIPKIEMTEPLKLELSHFITCVDNRTRPLTDGVNGLNVLRVLAAAQASLKNGGMPVDI